MAALFSNCTVVEQRAVILLWSEDAKRSDVYRKILALCSKCRGLLFKELLCSPKRLVHIPLQPPLRRSGSSNLNFPLPPSYTGSPVLAYQDCSMFGPLTETLRRLRFASDEGCGAYVDSTGTENYLGRGGQQAFKELQNIISKKL
jgi:hypothetical protein